MHVELRHVSILVIMFKNMRVILLVNDCIMS